MSEIDIRDAFFNTLYDLGRRDKDLMVITGDMDAWGLRKFKTELPKQFINIGVSEQNLVDVASGLAACGKRVFVYGICTYITMRCFEQIKFSVCSMNLPVTIIGAGAGFSFSFDGPTHHGTSDIAIMRVLPEMTIYSPCDEWSARASAILAYKSKHPIYVRLDKGVFPNIWESKDNFLKGFKVVREMSKVNIVSTGFMTSQAILINKHLRRNFQDMGVVDLFRLKPLAADFYSKIIAHSEKVITLEENNLTGGVGSLVSELISDNQGKTQLVRIAAGDCQLIAYGSRNYLRRQSLLDLQSIERRILE